MPSSSERAAPEEPRQAVDGLGEHLVALAEGEAGETAHALAVVERAQGNGGDAGLDGDVAAERDVVAVESPTYFGVLQAVLANLGIGVLPDYLTASHPDLVRVFPDHESGEVPVFLAYPEELRQTRRVAVFRDFVLEEIQAYRRHQSQAGVE